MKILVFLLGVVVVGCGVAEHPLEPDPIEELAEVPQINGEGDNVAEKRERETAVIKIYSGSNMPSSPVSSGQRITTTGTGLQSIWTFHRGYVAQIPLLFLKDIYHLLAWEIVEVTDRERWTLTLVDVKYVNVLDNQIPAVHRADVAAAFREEKGLDKRANLTIAQSREVSNRYRELSPFLVGDEIEVEVKHRAPFKMREKDEPTEMLFVNVLRNLTRPHIVYPQQMDE